MYNNDNEETIRCGDELDKVFAKAHDSLMASLGEWIDIDEGLKNLYREVGEGHDDPGM